jgi:hypothetical protein
MFVRSVAESLSAPTSFPSTATWFVMTCVLKTPDVPPPAP